MGRCVLLHGIGMMPGRYIIDPERLKIILGYKKLSFSFDDGYLSIYEPLLKMTKDIMRLVVIYVPASKVGKMNDWDKTGELAGQPLMSWENLIVLHDAGARIGSHGLNHLDLRNLSDRDLEKELKESKGILEEKLNACVDGLAYPFGYFDDRVIKFVQGAGYKEAYTTCDSILPGRGNPYRKRRIEIKGTDPGLLAWMKLSGLYDARALWDLPRLLAEKALAKRYEADHGNKAV